MYLFKDWNEKSNYMKTLFILKLIIGPLGILISIFSFNGIAYSDKIMLVLGMFLIINGLESYDDNKPRAIVIFCLALLIFYVGLSKLIVF